MNINMKYYIVTIGSIFLALGIGMIVGFNLNYDQELSKQQNEVLTEFETRFDELSKENETLKTNNDKLEDYIAKNYNTLVSDALKNKNTGIILTNEKNDYSEELKKAIEDANGNLAFNIVIKDSVDDEAVLAELSKIAEKDIKTPEDCVNYIIDCINGDNAKDDLKELEDLKLVEVKYLQDGDIAYDSVILVGENEDENMGASFEVKEKNIISKLKSEKIYLVAVQRQNNKSEFAKLCSELNISTINNIDTEIGKLSLTILISDESKVGSFGLGEDVEDLMPFSK